MRKIILLMFAIFFFSLISADIIITEQPKNLYNLGNTIRIPMKIVAQEGVKAPFSMELWCNGLKTEVYKADMQLLAGEEQALNPIINLDKNRIGRSTGVCKIKAIFGENYILTNEFQISDLIIVEPKTEKVEFAPEKNIIIEGEAKKENQDLVNGFIQASIVSEKGETIEIINTVTNGYFFTNFSFPKSTPAGPYSVKLNVFEKEKEEITNSGLAEYNILITQVPTNLELVIENPDVEPGTNFRVKTVLHDQTGEKIASSSIITIKNKLNETLEQVEKPTDELLEFPVAKNELPANWTVLAVSGKLTSESVFRIKEKPEVDVVLINKTVTIINMGNVFYNKSVLVKIGNSSVNINVSLDIGENKKYLLSAPNGDYTVEIITDEGSKVNDLVALTGKSVDVKEISKGVVTLMKHPIVWIFIIAVLGFIVFIIFKKGYKRSFFGYISSKKKEKKQSVPSKRNLMINTKNNAEISLSIQGDKQDVSMICLKLKNFKEIESNKSGVKETLQKISDLLEEKKVATYENQDNLFFILAPVKTKTFQNEKSAVGLAQQISKILTEHNNLFKQKIDFGISLNYGTIIAKQQQNILKFMSLGTLMTTAKKIAALSESGILLSDKIKDRLMSNVKTEKHEKDKLVYYVIKEIKDAEEHKKFIRNFLDRIERKE